ncbi:hypothetical protein FRC00_012757, partial [Tulasnella sp. 408]
MARSFTLGPAFPFLRGRSPTKKRIPFEVLYEDSACPFTLGLTQNTGRPVLSDVTELFVRAECKFSPDEADPGETYSPARQFGLHYPDTSQDAENTVTEQEYPLSEALGQIQTDIESSLEWVVDLHDRVGFRTEATQNLLMVFGHLKYWTNAVSEELSEEERASIIAFNSPRIPWNPQKGSISVN